MSRQMLCTQTLNALSLSLQRQQDGYSRLKRVCLIGDHNQLPPVVKNMAFQKYSHLDQSLFARFVRLGMPYVQLNAQVCSWAWTMCPSFVSLHRCSLCSVELMRLLGFPVILAGPCTKWGTLLLHRLCQ